MMTQYLYGKPVTLWDEYLHQALFAVRIRKHAVSKYSPFFLLYGVDPRLPGDPSRPELDADQPARLEGIIAKHAAANVARMSANRLLVERAIRAGLVRDQVLKRDPDIPVGNFVLVRDESPRKFKPKWFGPYKVALAAPIGTYALQDAHGNVLKFLIHGNRLLPLHPNAVDKELETIREREWLDLLIQRLDRFKLGEGKLGDAYIDQALFDKLHSRVELKEKLEKEEAKKELVEELPLPSALLNLSTPPEQARSSQDRTGIQL
jgi:hypothetical protein